MVTVLLGTAPLLTVMPLVARHAYGGAVGYSWLVSAFAAGGVLGGVIALRLRASRPLLVPAGRLLGIAEPWPG